MAKLHFYYSAMNAGKSTTLLQSNYNYQERGMDTLLYTPMVDDRYGVGKISTRLGLQADALAIDKEFNIYEHAKQAITANPNIACILIDEAQFLTKQQIFQLCKITDLCNKPVLAYGLRSDYKAEPFEGSMYLMALADNLIELKTICHCGKKATMVLRMDAEGNVLKDGDQVVIGGNESYTSVCRKHYFSGQSRPEDVLKKNKIKAFHKHEEVCV